MTSSNIKSVYQENAPPGDKRAPLVDSTYKLYVAWYFRSQTFPKKDKFTIGQKTENLLLDAITDLTLAYHTKGVCGKLNLLAQADAALESVKILIRLAKDIKILNLRWYVDYEERLHEIGRMLGGWLASLDKTNR